MAEEKNNKTMSYHYIELDEVPSPELDTAQKSLSVQFPTWMVEKLDYEADRVGVSRQAILKIIVDEGLQQRKRNRRI